MKKEESKNFPLFFYYNNKGKFKGKLFTEYIIKNKNYLCLNKIKI